MNAPESKAIVEPHVLESIEANGVATLTMNRPGQFNALSTAMMASLQAVLDRLATDASVRVVVLAGAGKAFCAGHDLREMKEAPSLEAYQALFAQGARLMRSLQRLPQPVIARVHGVATAAGCQLVASCDLAVAADVARFGTSGINVGLFCTTPGVAVARNVGRKAAFEMLVTGDLIDATTAARHGLVNRVVATAALDQEIARLTASIVAKPAVAVAMGKEAFYRQIESGVDAAYQIAGQTMACNLIDPVAQEGLDAFINKRAPNWSRGSAGK